MTHEEIDEYEREWRDIISVLRRSPRAPTDFNDAKQRFRELAAKVGASEYAPGGESDASISHFSHNIQQALQTASMIDACRTAAKNHEIVLKAQESARLSQWISLAAMVAAAASAVAAWVLRP